MIKMAKKSEVEEKKEEISVSEDIPFILKRTFAEYGITDEKKISKAIRGK